MLITKIKAVNSIFAAFLILCLPNFVNAEEPSLNCFTTPFCSAPPPSWHLYSQPLSTPFGTYLSFFNYGRGQIQDIMVDSIVYSYLSYCLKVNSYGEDYDTVHSEKKLYLIEASFSEFKIFKKLKKYLTTRLGQTKMISSDKTKLIKFVWIFNRINIEIQFKNQEGTGKLLCQYVPLSNIVNKERDIIDAENYISDDAIKKILELTSQYERACDGCKMQP
jgi:hypothetical protein